MAGRTTGQRRQKGGKSAPAGQRPGNDTLCHYEPLVSVSLIDPAELAACESEDDLLGWLS